MPEQVPCPNPACKAVFAPESLRGATRFTCPLCGIHFQFRVASSPAAVRGQSAVRRADAGNVPPSAVSATAATLNSTAPADALDLPGNPPARSEPPLPPKSAAKLVAPPTVTAPARTPDYRTTEAASPPPPPDGAIIRRRLAVRRTNKFHVVAVLIIVLTGLVATALGSLLLYRATMGSRVELAGKPDVSHVFPPLTSDWKRDNELQLRLQVNRAARHTQPAAGMAFFYHDYKTRLPTKAEMIDSALEKLHNQFKRLEWEPSTKEARLGGQEAMAFDFDATDSQDVDVLGTAYLLGYRGIGYWLILWAPTVDANAAAGDLERVRNSFTLNPVYREGWREKIPETIPLPIAAVDLVVACSKSVWEEEDLSGYDPKAVHVVKGTFPADGNGKQRDRHAGRAATVQMLVLNGAAGKAEAQRARNYVLESQKDPVRGGYPKTSMTIIKGKDGVEQDRAMEFGGEHGRVTKIRMANTEDRERFVVLATIGRPNGRLLVIWCESDWDVREYWDQEFAALLNSIRPLKTAEASAGKTEE